MADVAGRYKKRYKAPKRGIENAFKIKDKKNHRWFPAVRTNRSQHLHRPATSSVSAFNRTKYFPAQ